MRTCPSGAARGLLALLAALGCRLAAAVPSKVTIEGRKILVDGVPLHLKGVNWNPIPVGRTHPDDLDYLGYAAGDGDLMKAAGVNAIRTYECVCDVEVLDALYAKGIYVLNTVFANAKEPLSDVERKVNAVKDHPAVLMWVVGNEWNYNGCYDELTHDECLWYVKEAAKIAKRLDSKHPVASIYGCLPQPETLANLSIIDVWGVNYYNGLHFTAKLEDLHWKTDRNGTGNLFDEWEKLSDKPLFIGEYGADAWDTIHDVMDVQSQAQAVGTLTRELNNHTSLDGGVCIGGMIFEFADEWWKDWSGTASTHDHTGFDWGGGPWPDFRFNEEWWGLVDIDRNPRPAYHAYKNVTRPVYRGAEAKGAAKPRAASLAPPARSAAPAPAAKAAAPAAKAAAAAPPPRRLTPLEMHV